MMKGSPSKKRRPIKIPMVFSPIFLVLLFAALPVSYVATWIHRARGKRSERRLLDFVKSQNRYLAGPDLERVIQDNRGTLIIEGLGFKGPYRWWWTPDHLGSITTVLPSAQDMYTLPTTPGTEAFLQWIDRYTNPESGIAMLAGSTGVSETLDAVNLLSESLLPRFELISGRALFKPRQ